MSMVSLERLRRRAEGVLSKRPPPAHPPVHDPQALTHELEVYQIELQMQNDELQRAQVDLEKSRQRYFELYDLAPVGYVTLGANGKVTEANLAAAKLLGLDRRALVGRPLSAFMTPPDADAFYIFRRAVLASDTARRCELSLVRKDGQLVPVRLDASAIASEGDPPSFCRCVLFERTTSLTTVDDAPQTNALEDPFREIAARIEHVFYIIDQDRTLSYVSPAYEKIWGAPSASICGMANAWPAAVHPDDTAAVEESLAQIYDGTPFDVEYRILSTDGDARWIRDRAFPVEEGGRIVRAIGFAQDVTAERKLEEELRHLQKMDAVGVLASGVASDFQAILQAVVTCVAVAAQEGLPTRARRHLQQAIGAATRGVDLAKQLMAFAHRPRADHEPLALDSLLASSAGLLQRLVSERIELVIEPGAPNAMIPGDSFQIEQILMSLASNAQDAMPNGGTLTIRTREFTRPSPNPRSERAAPARRYVRLVVRDVGVGMDERTKARIFEPFFSTQFMTKGLGLGTGLGLSTVFAVTNQLGGRVEVESAKDEGTTFTLEFPCVETEPHTEEGRTPRFRGTALLVEGEPLLRTLLRQYLEDLGLGVLEAADVEWARHLSDSHDGHLDVLITDVFFAGTSGPKLAKSLRETHPEMRTLYISAHPRGALVETETVPLDAPMLEKPFGKAALAAVLETLSPQVESISLGGAVPAREPPSRD